MRYHDCDNATTQMSGRALFQKHSLNSSLGSTFSAVHVSMTLQTDSGAIKLIGRCAQRLCCFLKFNLERQWAWSSFSLRCTSLNKDAISTLGKMFAFFRHVAVSVVKIVDIIVHALSWHRGWTLPGCPILCFGYYIGLDKRPVVKCYFGVAMV